MSRFTNQIAVTDFDQQTKHEYQATGSLRGCFRERTGVIGDSATFNLMGKGKAHERTAPSSDVKPMGVKHSTTKVYLKDYEAPEYTDLFGKKEVNIDEVAELATTTKNAIGRLRDQIAIDGMGNIKANEYLGGKVLGDSTKTLGLDLLLEIKELFDDNEVDEENRFIAVTPQGITSLLNETKVTSSDYQSIKALERGEVNTLLGMTFKRIGKREEGGLPQKDASTQYAYAWDKSAVGEAIGLEVGTSVDWIPTKQSYLSIGLFKGGAEVIDKKGIVKLQYKKKA